MITRCQSGSVVPKGVRTLGERLVTAARLAAAEHVRQEIERLRGHDAQGRSSVPSAEGPRSGPFGDRPIFARDEVEILRVAVRRARSRPGEVFRDTPSDRPRRRAA